MFLTGVLVVDLTLDQISLQETVHWSSCRDGSAAFTRQQMDHTKLYMSICIHRAANERIFWINELITAAPAFHLSLTYELAQIKQNLSHPPVSWLEVFLTSCPARGLATIW